MKSIVSYPDRGNFGKSSYRGNCSGKLIEDIIAQYNLKQLSDFMVGSGTTEDVVKAKGIEGSFADLNRGYDMMSMEIPERSENIFWHPPYHDMVVYSGRQYSDSEVEKKYGFDPKVNDLSRCTSWEDFVQKMNYCMLKQFHSLENGGRMFVLMGDMKRRGKLYSMLCDIAKPGTLEQIIIKTQNNCVSSSTAYRGSFLPIVHEYLMVVRKENGLIVPVTYVQKKDFDIRDSKSAAWRDIVIELVRNGNTTLGQLYSQMEGRAKTLSNIHWKEKIRQVVQNTRYFRRVAEGTYALAS
jgi:hypothetical protein